MLDVARQVILSGELVTGTESEGVALITVLIGGYGQLGRDLQKVLPGTIHTPRRSELDITNADSIANYCDPLKPDLIINCAAYNFVDRAESEPTVAFDNNGFGPRNLAQYCLTRTIYLTHFSTDYVFGLSESRRQPFHETDLPNPVSVYGTSKLAGEYFIQAICPNHLIIRTCGLYGVWGSGGKGGNFIETMIRLGSQNPQVRVVDDQYCTPSYTVDVATATIQLIHMHARGIFHVTNQGETTWFRLARHVFQKLNLPAELIPITSQEFNATARRPAFSVLSNEKFHLHADLQLREWTLAVESYLSERLNKE